LSHRSNISVISLRKLGLVRWRGYAVAVKILDILINIFWSFVLIILFLLQLLSCLSLLLLLLKSNLFVLSHLDFVDGLLLLLLLFLHVFPLDFLRTLHSLNFFTAFGVEVVRH